jgi:putative ABC transport system permease protein
MFKNNVKLALRNLLKNKVFSAVNILGLGIGVAVCLLMPNFIQFQRSCDAFQAGADRIFRVPRPCAKTTAGQSWRAALANPVKSLRSE